MVGSNRACICLNSFLELLILPSNFSWEKYHSSVPATSQNFEAKSQKQPRRWLYKSHQKCPILRTIWNLMTTKGVIKFNWGQFQSTWSIHKYRVGNCIHRISVKSWTRPRKSEKMSPKTAPGNNVNLEQSHEIYLVKNQENVEFKYPERLASTSILCIRLVFVIYSQWINRLNYHVSWINVKTTLWIKILRNIR